MKNKYFFLCILVLLFSCSGRSHKKVNQLEQPIESTKIIKMVIDSKSDTKLSIDSIVDLFSSALDSHPGRLNIPEMIAVANLIPNYRSFLKEYLPLGKNLNIDFIGQIHVSDPSVNAIIPLKVISCQKNIKKILDSINYDVIGHESLSLWEFNEKTYMQEFYHSLNMQYSEKDLTFKNLSYENTCKIDGVIAFWIKNPNAHIVGVEDSSLYDLNIAAMQHNDSIGYEIVKLRSYIAIARLIKIMNQRGYKRGVLVLGVLHAKDIILIAKHFGIKMNVYSE